MPFPFWPPRWLWSPLNSIEKTLKLTRLTPTNLPAGHAVPRQIVVLMARTFFPTSPTALLITPPLAELDFFLAFSIRASCAFLATSLSLRMVPGDFGLCI